MNYPDQMKTQTQSKIIVTTCEAIFKWSAEAQAFCGKNVSVWYFGDQYSQMRQLQVSLPGPWSQAPVGERVNEIALRLREDFINLDRHLRRAGSDALAWHAGDIAERSPYASSFTLNACRLVAVQEAVSLGGVHIIVTDTLNMARPFWRAAETMGGAVGWMSPGNHYGVHDALNALADGSKLCIRALRARAGGVYALVKRIRKVRALRKSSPVPLEGLKSCDTLALLWTQKDTFPADAPLVEALSLGRLPEVIRSGGRRIGYISSPVYWLDAFDDIAANGAEASDDVLLLEDALSIFDVLRVAWASLFLFKAFQTKVLIGGQDVTPILRLEMGREWESWRPAYARLFACVGRYLAQNGITPQSLVHLYENHSWEKCLRLGVRWHLPDTLVVGCQQSPFSPLYINFLPTRSELQDGEAVDRLMVSGPYFRDVMSRVGFPDQEIQVIGAIRYQFFFDASRDQQFPKVRNYKGKVLCATGSDPEDCCELVAKVAEAAAGTVGVIVNFHPLTDEQFRADVMACARSAGASLDHVEFSTDGIQTLLGVVDAVLYSDTNSCFEALSRGLPVIHVGRDCALDYNKMPEAYSINVRSVIEIGEVLRDIAAKQGYALDQAKAWAGVEAALGKVDKLAILASLTTSS